MAKNRKPVSLFNKIFYFVLAFFVRFLAGLLFGLSIKADEKVRHWKRDGQSFIILCAHPSEIDAIVLLSASFPKYARFVVGSQQLYKGTQGKILQMLGVIPKKQFVSDIHAVKEIMKSVKTGHIVGMMPEGRVSMDGTENPVEMSTAKLLKQLGVPVALLVPHGSYFVKPPYNNKSVIRGKMSAELSCLFTEDELRELCSKEILEHIENNLVYNASEELRGSGHKYGSAKKIPMQNVENLFYLCPKCKKTYTIKRNGTALECSCGLRLRPNREMFFASEEDNMPDTVFEWNKLQLAYEECFWKEDTSLSFKVRESKLTIGEKTDYKDFGSGVLTLSCSGFSFDGENEAFEVPLQSIPGVSADYQLGFIAYYKGSDIRRFTFEDKRDAARFVNSLMTIKKLHG